MKSILVVAAALVAASAFAQSSVTSSTGVTVQSASGVTVTPGVPTATVEVTPHTSVAMPSRHLLPGGAMVQSSSTTVLGGPSGNVAGTKTEVNTYWSNVPADVQADGNFQRWRQLK